MGNSFFFVITGSQEITNKILSRDFSAVARIFQATIAFCYAKKVEFPITDFKLKVPDNITHHTLAVLNSKGKF